MSDASTSYDYSEECVACGEWIAVVNNKRQRHECPKKRESARKSANTRGYDALVRRESFDQRLAAGFEMLADDDMLAEGEE